MPLRLCATLLLATAVLVPGADPGPALLGAARRGDTARIEKLIAEGAPVDARDKDGRTPLMLAAQRGHADAVRVLLAKGARPDLRDHDRSTAYLLALLSSAGGRGEVLEVLPQPPKIRMRVEARVESREIYSSCFLRPEQLAAMVRDLKLDRLVLKALWQAAAAPPRAPVELALDEPAQTTLALRIRPSAACQPGQSADDVRLAIGAQLTREPGTVIWEKTFGGGLKGLHAQSVTSAAQYETVFGDWVKAHAAEIYWGAVGALLRLQAVAEFQTNKY